MDLDKIKFIGRLHPKHAASTWVITDRSVRSLLRSLDPQSNICLHVDIHLNSFRRDCHAQPTLGGSGGFLVPNPGRGTPMQPENPMFRLVPSRSATRTEAAPSQRVSQITAMPAMNRAARRSGIDRYSPMTLPCLWPLPRIPRDREILTDHMESTQAVFANAP
jgi:hypothetical protein